MEIKTINKIAIIKASVNLTINVRINVRFWLYVKVVTQNEKQQFFENEYIATYLYQFSPIFLEYSFETWEVRKEKRVRYYKQLFERNRVSNTILTSVINSTRHTNN